MNENIVQESIISDEVIICRFLDLCASRYNLDDSATWRSIKVVSSRDRQLAFLFFVMVTMRNSIKLGTPPPYPLPPLTKFFDGQHACNCGVYSAIFQKITSYIGYSSRLIHLQSKDKLRHVGIEVQIEGEWTYFDPLFYFFSAHNGRPLSAKELVRKSKVIRKWEEAFSVYFLRYSVRLSKYFWRIETIDDTIRCASQIRLTRLNDYE